MKIKYKIQLKLKLCVIFSGSLTWPPLRQAILDYLKFSKEFKEKCKCYFVYIKEAHFVERD